VGEFKPPLPIDNSAITTFGLQDASIGYIAQASLAIFRFEVDGDSFLPVCDGRAYDMVDPLKASSTDAAGVLRGALYLQAMNWAKTEEYWDQISTHHQRIRHAFATGRRLLNQIESLQKEHKGRKVLGYENFKALWRLTEAVPAIKLLVFKSQFINLLIYGLARISRAWNSKLVSYQNSTSEASIHRIAEAAALLLDWREEVQHFFRMRQQEWRRLRKLESLDQMESRMPKIRFTLGNPIGLQVSDVTGK
jgi:hypothetical protein